MLQRERRSFFDALTVLSEQSPEASSLATCLRSKTGAGRRLTIAGRVEILGNKAGGRCQLWIASRFRHNRLCDIILWSRKASHCTLSDL
jgi:hypothetical protein